MIFRCKGGVNNENIVLIAHVLGYGYSEIINLSLSDFSEFLEISVKILKAKSEL